MSFGIRKKLDSARIIQIPTPAISNISSQDILFLSLEGVSFGGDSATCHPVLVVVWGPGFVF